MTPWIAGPITVVGVAALAWGWFEAGWVRRRVVEVEVEGLAPELDGLRIARRARQPRLRA